MATCLGVPQLALCAHQVYKVTAQGSLIGDAIDENITAGLDWLVRVIDGDFATLQARIATQTEQFTEADTARREAASAQAKANLAARAAAAAAQDVAGTTAQPAAGATTAAPSAAGAVAEPTAAAAAKPAKAKASAPACFVPGCGQPAVRRAQAAGWQAVCDACGDVLLSMPVSDLKARLAAGETSKQVLASQQGSAASGVAQGDESPHSAAPAAAAGSGGDSAQTSAQRDSDSAGDRGAKSPQAAQVAFEKDQTPRANSSAPAADSNSPSRMDADEPTASAGKPGVAVASGNNSVAGDADEHTEEEITIISPNKMAAAAHSASGAQQWRTHADQDELAGQSDVGEAVRHSGAVPAVPGAVTSQDDQ